MIFVLKSLPCISVLGFETNICASIFSLSLSLSAFTFLSFLFLSAWLAQLVESLHVYIDIICFIHYLFLCSVDVSLTRKNNTAGRERKRAYTAQISIRCFSVGLYSVL